MSLLKDKVIIITGSTRGIGRSIALRFAKEKAKIVVVGKSAEEHPKLPGTIYSVADEVTKLGGISLPIQADLREENQISNIINQTITEFGKIDICVNNASALCLDDIEKLSIKKWDLMHKINVRSTFLMSKLCLPYLKKSSIPNILNISPPINLDPKWLSSYLGYTISKYGMSLCTLGMSTAFQKHRIRVNSLWPKTTIATSAIKYNFSETVLKASRVPEIMSDAAFTIITHLDKSGVFYIDEEVLLSIGIKDFSKYLYDPSIDLLTPDLYI
ncbi:MAG: SDR family oxidoreductase [Legionellales bacterium]|nr:SDR family oxidoreductase [Legionellales bacterium]